MDALTEQEILGRVAAGDQSALGVLYERHVRSVFRFSLAELRSREDAEDITHEVFLTLVARANTIRIPGDSVLPWLLVTSRNLCRNRQRSRARDVARRSKFEEAYEAAAPETPESAAELNDLRRAVAAAIDGLSGDERRLFELCIEGDMSYQAAADSLGISHAGVRNRVSRVRARLRHTLSPN
jgi:RNA polymerase sigma factor (sigma-70 family)